MLQGVRLLYIFLFFFLQNAAENSYLEPIADTINLLDFCHSHVIVDKALQSVLLLLENTSMTRRFQDVSAQKSALEKENETLKKQVHSLLSEADNLSGRRTETSSMLGDVIKSKAQLEDDFSSVFQLYNTRGNGKREQEEKGADCWRDCAISGRLQAEISKLMESNVKLKEELAGTVREKKTLENQLTACKVSVRGLVSFYVTMSSVSVLCDSKFCHACEIFRCNNL